jgi:hypothetical protein
MPITNTLETARRIEALGSTHQQAQGLSDLLVGSAQDAVREMKSIVSQESQVIRAEIRAAVAELTAEFREELRKQMLWFFAMQVALFGAALAILKFF